MNRSPLTILAALILLSPTFARAAGERRPNLGLELRAGERAAAPHAPMAPALEDQDEDDKGRARAAAQEPQSYDEAVRDFEKNIDELRPDVKNAENLPFLMTHGVKTKRSILMVHGLTDSPYYMKALAKTFFEQGYNVVAVLLPGHGTKPEDLLHVLLREWREEVEYGMSIAEQLGEEVSLAGFSTGGALVVDALNRNFSSRAEPRRLGGLYLFSPALKIANPNAYQACIPGATLLRPWVQDHADQIVEDHPYRYRKMATNAVCQLYKQTFINATFRHQTMNHLAERGIPVFAVQSQADNQVSSDAVDEFMRDAGRLPNGPATDYISYPREAGIPHADVTRPESNPAFGQLETRLKAFLARREAAIPPNGQIRRATAEPPTSE